MNDYGDYINGHVERTAKGEYTGRLSVEGIDLSPIQAQYFKKDGDIYCFIKRRPIMEYSMEQGKYITRERKPQLLIYMKKQVGTDGVVEYKGEFMFMRFRFSIVGVWDKILGRDTNLQRLNLFVERLPMSEQTLLNSINERKRNDKK